MCDHYDSYFPEAMDRFKPKPPKPRIPNNTELYAILRGLYTTVNELKDQIKKLTDDSRGIQSGLQRGEDVTPFY